MSTGREGRARSLDSKQSGCAMIFKKILVAVDGGAPATRAAATAHALAVDLKAKLRLFHAVELPAKEAHDAISSEDARRQSDRESREIIANLIGMLSHDLRPEGLWRIGDAANEILRAAGEWNADLLVLGSHGRDGVARMILGSVAEKVMRRASCPVLVIKASEKDSVAPSPPPAEPPT
jgi:nucleotide-binding universal stress UspA family protein